MKKQSVSALVLTVGSALFSLSANAGMNENKVLICKQALPAEGVVTLKLKHTGPGTASIEFNSMSEAVTYTGAIQDKTESAFSSLYHYSLVSDEGQQAKLSIGYWTVTSGGRGGFGCGRGGCDLPDATTSIKIGAELELSGGKAYDLSCYESVN